MWLCLDWNSTPCPVPGWCFDSVVIASRTGWLNKNDITQQVCSTPPRVDLWPFGRNKLRSTALHGMIVNFFSVFIFFGPTSTWMKHSDGFLTDVCVHVWVCQRETDYVRRGNEIVGSCCWPTRHHLGSVFSVFFFLCCLFLALCFYFTAELVLSVWQCVPGSVYSYSLTVYHTLHSQSSCPLCKVCVF